MVRPLRCFCCLVLLPCLGDLPASRLRAAHPDDPQVRAIVDKALQTYGDLYVETREGGICLIALAHYKATHDTSGPWVTKAIKTCQAVAKDGKRLRALDNYSLALSLMMLAEMQMLQQDHHEDIQLLLQELYRRQRPHGGWTYEAEQVGDTSQTQYAVLGLWTLQYAGVEIAVEVVEQVCHWLIRTQDASGGFSYHPQDPGSFSRLRQEPPPTLSLTAAALGSLYMCADILGIQVHNRREETGPLPGLIEVRDEDQGSAFGGGRQNRSQVNVSALRQAIADGNQWFARNYKIDSGGHTCYYLYALERYQSLRELAENREEPSPRWYNDGVFLTQSRQVPAGTINIGGGEGPVIDTAFAVLFLVRNMKQSLPSISEGLLRGGRGLPQDLSRVRIQEGQVVSPSGAGSLQELLEMLERGEIPDLQEVQRYTPRPGPETSAEARARQLELLKQKIAAPSFEERLVAVRVLARQHPLDPLEHVPLLIYALTDPDLRVVREAEHGLRFISRKFEGFGLPVNPSPAQIEQSIAAWKNWYRSLRPRGELLQ